jgi:hypothetical protein
LRQVFGTTVIIALLAASYADADPVITSTEGSWVNGSTVTIRGSNFGVKQHAPPLLWDTVDNISAYDGVADGEVIPAGSGYPWSGNGSPWADPIVRHDQNGRSWYRAYVQGYFSHGNLGSNQIYVNWWVYPSADISTESNKLIRIWSDGSGEVPNRLSWTGMHLTAYKLDNGNPVSLVSWPSWGGHVGDWNHQEIYVDSRRALQGEGRIRCWTNGRLIHNHDDMYATEPLQYMHRFGLDVAYSSHFQGEYFDFGYVYLDTTQAHVIVANNANLGQATHTEVQIPQSWSRTSIVVSANQGWLNAGTEVFFFVFDGEGRHNSVGFPAEGVEVPGQPGQPQRLD